MWQKLSEVEEEWEQVGGRRGKESILGRRKSMPGHYSTGWRGKGGTVRAQCRSDLTGTTPGGVSQASDITPLLFIGGLFLCVFIMFRKIGVLSH